ncbi:MAG TPA: serine/threonine-protein kinase [Polyangiaceae bacterium]|nr:serine/threonine-protein kinase [Polyangiaceae bacterium]
MSSGENRRSRGTPRPLSGGPLKFGPYWLDARLAVGGTAEVYVARPIDPKAQPRKLIVKRLLPHFVSDPEGRTMFEREAALHAAVRHENVVRVYASGMAGGEPWLAMELVDGCDLYRLLRRLTGDSRKLTIGVSAYVARQVLSALGSVHEARDAQQRPMYIVHRDVTPSNIYLSTEGKVKLGDFGIARAHRATFRSAGSDMLKGKLAYLAPEQVAGEPFDLRADLFSIAVVLAEMLLGKPLFAGSGQLAVLLAIRDCRIDPLRQARGALPEGLYDVVERALSRDPGQRFQSAAELSAALAPFDAHAHASSAELGALVRWVQSAPSAEQMQAVRESAGRIRAAVAARKADQDETVEYAQIPSTVVTQSGARLGPWPFARLVEAIATGEVIRGDEVAYMGRPLAPVETIEELSRFLPARSVTTDRVAGVGTPEFVDDVSTESLVRVLLRVAEREATGVLFAEGPGEPRRPDSVKVLGGGDAGRKELYFVRGKLHHVASNDASELLGEYLVRRGMISRDELDFALAVLPRYGGRMGDTLISLGLAASLDIFQAIRDQGRDRILPLFQWRSGRVIFFAGHTAPHVEFPLDLDVVPLVLAGVEAAESKDGALERWRPRFGEVVASATAASAQMRAAAWPPLARRLVEVAEQPMPLRDVLSTMAQSGATTAGEVLRALEVLLIARLVTVG